MRRTLLLLAALLLVPIGAFAQTYSPLTISTSDADADCTPTTKCAIFSVNQKVASLSLYINIGTSATLVFEATIDDSIWFALDNDAGDAGASADGEHFFTNPGYKKIRVRATALSGNTVITALVGPSSLRSTATLTSSGDATAAHQITQNGYQLDIEAHTDATATSTANMDITLDNMHTLMTTAGTAISHTSAASVSEHDVKTSAGVLYSLIATNTSATVTYLRCVQKTAANSTPGSETLFLDLAVPGSTAGAGLSAMFPIGLTFTPALSCYFATGEGQADTTGVGANDLKIIYSIK